MVLAYALANKGYRIAVMDKALYPTSPVRGEIIQPNGLKVLDELGFLSPLLEESLHRNYQFHFYKSNGISLCTIDYQTLPEPYNYSLILLPGVLQKVLMKKWLITPNIEIFWGATFQSVLWNHEKVVGVEAEYQGKTIPFYAPMVVGGDGVHSNVRTALKIEHQLHTYSDGYLTMVVERPSGFKSDSKYYLGNRTILGAFPISKDKLYLFYMISTSAVGRFQSRGVAALKKELLSLNKEVRTLLEKPFQALSSWDDISFMPCHRVKCQRWVTHGGALIGDAAHAMNPHAAQGRNTALEDGVVLAKVIENCFKKKGDFSQVALAEYEDIRRPGVDYLQHIADELTWLWNTGWPPLIWARNHAFRTLHQNHALRDKWLATLTGVNIQPFTFYDRFRSLLPVWQKKK